MPQRKMTFTKRSPKKVDRKVATVGTVKKLIRNRIVKNVISSNIAGGAVIQAGTVYNVDGNLGGSSHLLNYSVRFSVTNAVNVNNSVRFILFQFRDDSTPTTNDVLTSTVLLSEYIAQDEFSKTVHILADKQFSMNLTDTTQRLVHLRIRGNQLRSLISNKDGKQNNLYLLALSSDADTNTTLSTMYFRYEYWSI